MLFQTSMTVLVLWNTNEDIFLNVGNQTVSVLTSIEYNGSEWEPKLVG